MITMNNVHNKVNNFFIITSSPLIIIIEMNYLADMDFLYYHFLSSSAYNYNYRHQNDDILRKLEEKGDSAVLDALES